MKQMSFDDMQEPIPQSHGPYQLRISRLTIDKLGVKLYDKVSAVVAELVANSYDADAEHVIVRLPLNTVLAEKDEGGKIRDLNYIIEVEDDGHGMTPNEAIDFYLEVGGDRRNRQGNGGRSRTKNRPVMGRKGIGKLAPFGICGRIEVISAGGDETARGYRVTHFLMDYDKITGISNSSDDNVASVPLIVGPLDETYQASHGTIIRLTNFLRKRVPDKEVFHRQLAARFVFVQPDFQVAIEDLKDPNANPPEIVKSESIPTFDETRIDVSTRPVITEEGEELKVTGWLAMARSSYKHDELAGVRIYARNKIVATTRDFEQPAGFTGEFTIRSYLVGEIFADWLDLDEGEDLIRTDRQSILWDSDYGRALKAWGAKLIREVGAQTRVPRRRRVRDLFIKKSNITELARERFVDQEIADVAIELANQIGSFAAEDELDDQTYVNDLTEMIFSVAPHRALIRAFQEFGKLALGSELSLEKLADLFGKTNLAELASYSQIAFERVQAIRELERTVHGTDLGEDEFQSVLAKAPWLIEPTWSVITKNQALKTFKTGFEHYFKQKLKVDIVLAIDHTTKRPDFTLVSVDRKLHIVEIKKAGYEFADSDFLRLVNYIEAFDDFFEKNSEVRLEFSRGYVINLVVDGVNLKTAMHRQLFASWIEKGKVIQSPWHDFLTKATNANEQFLLVNDRIREQELRYPAVLEGPLLSETIMLQSTRSVPLLEEPSV